MYYRNSIEEVEPTETNATQKFLLKIADYCFTHNIRGEKKEKFVYKNSFNDSEENNLGLTDLIGEYIYDHVIDGVECQVISPDDFFDCLAKYDIKVDNESERMIVQRVLKLTSTDQNWYFVNNLVTILSSVGIREHVPEDTPFLKYSNLKGRDIRIINRLNFIIDKYNVKDIRKIFTKIIFTQKVVSLKQNSKERVIEL